MPKSSSNRGLVLVTGGSGYVAGYCIAELLNNGWSPDDRAERAPEQGSASEHRPHRRVLTSFDRERIEKNFRQCKTNASLKPSASAQPCYFRRERCNPHRRGLSG